MDLKDEHKDEQDRAEAQKGEEALAAPVPGRVLNMELFISYTLRIGVMVSSAVIAAGVLLWLFTGTTGYAAHSWPVGPGAVWQGLLQARPYAVIDAGLLLLILTPVFRVGASIVAFALERDRAYVLITSIVFIFLLIGLLLGKSL